MSTIDWPVFIFIAEYSEYSLPYSVSHYTTVLVSHTATVGTVLYEANILAGLGNSCDCMALPSTLELKNCESSSFWGFLS